MVHQRNYPIVLSQILGTKILISQSKFFITICLQFFQYRKLKKLKQKVLNHFKDYNAGL